MTASFILVIVGTIFLKTGFSFYMAVIGLIILGAGLGGGFPIMLGIVGERFRHLSGTAFSIALVIALVGNTLINYCMGIIAQNFGVKHLTTVGLVELVGMVMLFFTIIMKIKNNNNN